MDKQKRPTVGLAFSGSGNRSTFYIGFLEVLSEAGITIDYIAAMSGGCLPASAFACGTLSEFKRDMLALKKEDIKNYITRSKERGGFYSLDLLEEEMLTYTKGMTFEEARPHMGFVAVDIENGEQVILAMGDIARAARISCTLPGIFEPLKWGGRTLVDGGLLSLIPLDVLAQAQMDVTIGINMRGTKHIFTDSQITVKKVLNFFKKYLLINGIGSLLNGFLEEGEQIDFARKPGIFTVLGKSMDLAIAANKEEEPIPQCDILISPPITTPKRLEFNEGIMELYYEQGRNTAIEYLPKIREVIKNKTHI